MLRQPTPKMWRPIHVSRRLAIEIGLGLLVVVAALLGAVWYMRYVRVETPAAVVQPYELTRPATMPNDGSAYVEYLTGRAAPPYELTRPATMPNDGSAYVEYLSRRPAPPYELTRPANMPNDGSAYVEYLSRRPAVNPNLPNIGTGSAHDGRSYGAGAPLVEKVNPNVPIEGTGSAYNPR